MQTHSNSPSPFAPRLYSPEARFQVAIITADPAAGHQLSVPVEAAGISTQTFQTVDEAIAAMQAHPADACIVGSLQAGDSAGSLNQQIQQKGWTTQLICVLPESSADEPSLLPASTGVEILHNPVSPTVLSLTVASACQRSQLVGENRRLRRQLANRTMREMVGNSSIMQRLRQDVQAIADLSVGVLIRGETGTGKDVVAQAIHDASRRAHRPFVKIDCSVLTAEALETELFGEITIGAQNTVQHHPGRIEQADGGTLLIDHVEAIALPMQKRLATVLLDQRFEQPQSGERIRFDVRVVFSTPADLESLTERGLFRPELLDSIQPRTVLVPALSDRIDDLGLLVEHFLRRQSVREGRPARALTVDALQLLQKHPWPGHVRELENVVERACSVDWGTRLTAAMLEPWLAATKSDEDLETSNGLTLAEMERKLIEATFVKFNGNREKTAKALQIGIRTLSGKLREYGYPPRGGPGSNLRPWSPDSNSVQQDEDDQAIRRAA